MVVDGETLYLDFHHVVSVVHSFSELFVSGIVPFYELVTNGYVPFKWGHCHTIRPIDVVKSKGHIFKNVPYKLCYYRVLEERCKVEARL